MLASSRLRKGTAPVVFVLFLMANPAYLTSCSEKESFDFGEREMNILVEDVSSRSWQAGGYTIEFDLQPTSDATALLAPPASVPTFIESATACESRTFVAGASACMATSEMPVTGNVWVLDDGGEMVGELQATGLLLVTGYHADNAELHLQFDEGQAVLTWRDDYTGGFILRQFQATGLGDDDINIEYENWSND
jgi:hypothetical protein